jgi:hypothetical protein
MWWVCFRPQQQNIAQSRVQLALVQWKIHFFPYAQGKHIRLVSTTLKLIDAQRDGRLIDQNVVKKVIDSFGAYRAL